MEEAREDYKSHRLELRSPEGEPEAQPDLWIDDELVPYGVLPDGSYYLEEYAYDWRDDPVDLARALIDYRAKADEVRREREQRSAG
jgi:hypothetical protein